MKFYSFLLTRISISILLCVSFALAQTSLDLSKAENYKKASPNLKLYIAQNKDYKRSKSQRFLIQVKNPDSFIEYLQQKDLDKYVTQTLPSLNVFALNLSPKKFTEDILPHPDVSFADVRMAVPKEERAISNFDLSVNKINYLHTNYPELQGDNITISIKEFRFDSLDIDLLGKNIPSPLSSSFVSTHATNMATMMAGRGNSFYAGRGVASGASLSSSSFFNLLPDTPTYYDNFRISVQNHSYGVDPENYYGIEAMAYDEQVNLEEHLIHVFSAGNIGNRNSVMGLYEGIEGFANLTGNFKMAKNVLVIGAVDSFLQVTELSSKGPAYDGRIKPELVTYGQDGSSGAAAITSGIIALLQEAYSMQYGNKPPASLIRAVLMNGADDIALPGPDFSSGYGNINALRSLENHSRGLVYTRANFLRR